MLREVLMSTVLCSIGLFSVGKNIYNAYEDFYYHSVYNGSKVTWMMMPDDNGLVVSSIIDGLTPKQVQSPNKVRFVFWNRQHIDTPLIKTYENLRISDFEFFDPRKRTVILIHGYTDSKKGSSFFDIFVKAFLEEDDYNIVGVDWTYYAHIPWYGQSVKNTKFVGDLTASMIEMLRSYNPREFHIVAYNLGTLVAGVAGSAVKDTKKIERITGLDPPYIFTENLSSESKLDKNDADLVEIIHTSGDYIGINDPVGHRDFYPNGGKWPQPGCIYDIADRCSPLRSIKYYEYSLRKKGGYLATECESYSKYLKGLCFRKPTIPLWNNATRSLQGKFYFQAYIEDPLFGVKENNAKGVRKF